jgi:hypothetical protein
MSAWLLAGLLLVSVATYLLLSGFVAALRKYRGTRVITCPENFAPHAVHVDVLRAAQWASLSGEPVIRLDRCTRWPERAGCGQKCLEQVVASPEACLVQNIVASWYAGKHCIFCKDDIGPIVWHDRPPAVQVQDGSTREWKDIRAERLPAAFRTGQPVCWRCHVTESFRREHADLVVERKHPAEVHHTVAPSSGVY